MQSPQIESPTYKPLRQKKVFKSALCFSFIAIINTFFLLLTILSSGSMRSGKEFDLWIMRIILIIVAFISSYIAHELWRFWYFNRKPEKYFIEIINIEREQEQIIFKKIIKNFIIFKYANTRKQDQSLGRLHAAPPGKPTGRSC